MGKYVSRRGRLVKKGLVRPDENRGIDGKIIIFQQENRVVRKRQKKGVLLEG